MSIDRFKERIGNMLFITTFHERITQLGRNMTNVMDASTSIKDSEAFRDLLNVNIPTIKKKVISCNIKCLLFFLDYFDGG